MRKRGTSWLMITGALLGLLVADRKSQAQEVPFAVALREAQEETAPSR